MTADGNPAAPMMLPLSEMVGWLRTFPHPCCQHRDSRLLILASAPRGKHLRSKYDRRGRLFEASVQERVQPFCPAGQV